MIIILALVDSMKKIATFLISVEQTWTCWDCSLYQNYYIMTLMIMKHLWTKNFMSMKMKIRNCQTMMRIKISCTKFKEKKIEQNIWIMTMKEKDSLEIKMIMFNELILVVYSYALYEEFNFLKKELIMWMKIIMQLELLNLGYLCLLKKTVIHLSINIVLKE